MVLNSHGCLSQFSRNKDYFENCTFKSTIYPIFCTFECTIYGVFCNFECTNLSVYGGVNSISRQYSESGHQFFQKISAFYYQLESENDWN